MRDSEIVAAIVAGDPAGLAAAYDRYGAALHTYCRALLAEPADAADAVQDTYVIAAAKLAGLRDPDRLRPWLYAVARNECNRRLRARARTTGLDEAAEMTDTEAAAEMGTGARRAELRDLVRAAIAGLNSGDREIIELNLRHELDGADLADALGVRLNQAHALQSRARGQLERSLGALLVARSGRESCPELGALLAGWDGHLTVLLRKRVNRHVEQCEECGARKRRELSPAMLLSVLPLAVLPAGLREQVLRLVADSTPEAVSYRAGLIRRAGRFGADGFPVPVAAAGRRRRGSRPLAAAAAVAAAAALIVTVMTVAYPVRHVAATTGPGHRGSTPSSAGVSPAASARAAATAVSPSVSPPVSPSITGTLPAVATPVGSRPVSSPPVTSSPGPAPTGTKPRPTGSPTPTPAPGTLSAAPAALTLVPIAVAPGYTGTFTLSAGGGPVAGFTIVAGPGLQVTPDSGSLTAGQTMTITVSTVGNGPPSFESPLTVNPGAVTVDVRYPPRG